ncbi:MAG: hypothetical protein KC473_00340, partial [Candidatus Dadabacteria bacterium]|nr:hypothetical protein [Candidatus Dadabacteria bacterium]
MQRGPSFEAIPTGLGQDSHGFLEDGYYEDGDGDYGFVEDAEEEESAAGDEARAPEENPYEHNHELRLINAYFKEVGMESLMRADEEIRNAAKIKECGAEKVRIEKRIRGILGKKNGRDSEELLSEARELLAGDADNPGLGKLKRLVCLYDVYTTAEARLKGRFVKANLRLVASLAK